MALVTTKDMFAKSMNENFAVGAFNINNMEIMQAIVDAAAESMLRNILIFLSQYILTMVLILKLAKCVLMLVLLLL